MKFIPKLILKNLLTKSKACLLYTYICILTLKANFKDGGEKDSTGIVKLKLHAEAAYLLVKRCALNIIADDYNYAVAA